MIDVNFLREKPDELKKAVAAKQLDPAIVDYALILDKEWKDLLPKVEILRNERNLLSKNYSTENLAKAKEIKLQLSELENKLSDLEKKRQEAIKEIPNLFSNDTPIGKDENENIVIRKWGDLPKFDFEPKDHLELGEKLGIIDVVLAAKVSGTRFGYFKGVAALLEFALIQYAINVLTDSDILKEIADKIEPGYDTTPFIPVIPPVMIRPEVFDRMARLKPEDDRYYIPTDDLYLIGSAEHTLGPLHMDQTLNKKDLPIRYAGFSTSFRRESGSYGKDTKGVLRVHQFDKVEMESFTTSDNSEKEQRFLVGIQEYLMQQLKLPYQVVLICTGDMAKPDYRQMDIETWMPGQNKYRETHSSDLIGDYQARRLNTKYRKGNKAELVHMNDATAFAIGRTIIAILENNQQEDGSIVVPEVLRKWVGKDKIVS